MADQGEPTLATQALRELLRQVARPEITAGAWAAAHRALLDLALRVRTARNDRLTGSGADHDAEKWATVLMLAVLTQAGTGLVQLDRSWPQAAAVCLFTTAAVVTLGMLAVRERPFDGVRQIRDSFSWQDGQGAAGYTGATLPVTGAGRAASLVTLAGLATSTDHVVATTGTVGGLSYLALTKVA